VMTRRVPDGSRRTRRTHRSDRLLLGPRRRERVAARLISGFRGAADLSGDGKVALNEAYEFAFNETLGRTVDTNGGAHHPN
jgi:hypothetical protein